MQGPAGRGRGWGRARGPGDEGAGAQGRRRRHHPSHPAGGGGPLASSPALHAQARPQRSMACAETGVLVGMEPQLWESRGPLHQSLLTLTLQDCHLHMRNLSPRGYVAAAVPTNPEAADLDLNPGLPDPKAQAGNHFAHLVPHAVFLTVKYGVASCQGSGSSMELVLVRSNLLPRAAFLCPKDLGIIFKWIPPGP